MGCRAANWDIQQDGHWNDYAAGGSLSNQRGFLSFFSPDVMIVDSVTMLS